MAPAARPRVLAPDNPRSQSSPTESISPDGRTQKILALIDVRPSAYHHRAWWPRCL